MWAYAMPSSVGVHDCAGGGIRKEISEGLQLGWKVDGRRPLGPLPNEYLCKGVRARPHTRSRTYAHAHTCQMLIRHFRSSARTRTSISPPCWPCPQIALQYLVRKRGMPPLFFSRLARNPLLFEDTRQLSGMWRRVFAIFRWSDRKDVERHVRCSVRCNIRQSAGWNGRRIV